MASKIKSREEIEAREQAIAREIRRLRDLRDEVSQYVADEGVESIQGQCERIGEVIQGLYEELDRLADM